MANIRARDWCFTLNNWTDDEVQRTESFSGKYIIYGFEVGESQTPHLQGYCEYENPVGMTRVKKDISSRVHIEKRQGTQSQAITYCKKDGNWWEKGEPRKGQGFRSDLQTVADEALKGTPVETIALQHPVEYIKYSRGIQALANMQPTPKWRNVEVIVFVGPTGTGKTRRAMAEESVFKLNQNTNGTLWFDGYQGESTLLLDDFYGWIKWGELLTLLDGYPYRCQLKGSFAWAKWDTVIITSNKEPKDWYDRADISALQRRISGVRHFEIID